MKQPQKGSHPDGIDVSALEYVLDGAETMPEDCGLFMPVTWRMAPAVCAIRWTFTAAARLSRLPT